LNYRIAALLAAGALLAACEAGAAPSTRSRALLIGIDDYSATTFASRPKVALTGRDWPNLKGAVTDVRMLQEMLVLLYGFDRRDIVTLTNQSASRTAILAALGRHLVQPSRAGDVVFFYFAGHGSQVYNSLSDEDDRFDESLVPADSRAGALDIRDKELRPHFNRILDRGAKLSILLDNCHSGSGARGLASGATARGIEPDRRDVADRTAFGARPEDRGALVLSATHDFDKAWERRDETGKWHGTFSWAWLRAMRDAAAGEPAGDTFLRAHARMSAETPFQEPVLGGDDVAQRTPFLGRRVDRHGDRIRVAVESVRRDGTVMLQGGWANGLGVGSELRLANEPENPFRLTVISIQGLGESVARSKSPNRAVPREIRSGALLEVIGWAAPPGRALRVWMPRVQVGADRILALTKALHDRAIRRNVHWKPNPLDDTPAYILRRGLNRWELVSKRGQERLTTDADAVAAVAKLDPGSSLFAQLPAPGGLIDAIDIDSDRDGITMADGPEDADYILVGRYSGRRLSYAWLRPAVIDEDQRKTGLPLQTRWIPEGTRNDSVVESALELREAVLRLRRIHAWLLLESPPRSRWSYTLGIRRERTNQWAESIVSEERYDFVLRARLPLPSRVQQRYVYVFVIDSEGKSLVFHPRNGSVENRYPADGAAPPQEIAVGDPAFGAPPYGIDTYFLLTTDEPLASSFILEWDGVRTGAAPPATALEQLLLLTASGTRGKTVVTPWNWSVERFPLACVAARSSK
jgi:hypothetical protein